TSYNYAVIFTPNIEGCVSATVDTIVTVYANPSVEITGDPIICDGTDVTLTANLNDSVINTTYTYQWMLANSDIAGATNRTLTQSQPATDNAYIYTVRVTNNVTGCVSVSAPFSVNVNEAPIVHITANETTVCSNGDVVMTAHLNDNNADNITYQWYRGAVDAANLIAGATNATYQTDALIATTEFFVVVSQTTSDCAVTNSITINVVDIPVISDIVMSDEVVCEGAQVTYTASAANGVAGDAYIYTWFRNGELVEGATGNTITVPAVILDNETNFVVYSATVSQASSGCNSELFIADTLFIRPNPSVEISGDAIICHNGMVNLTANLNDTTNAVGTYSYQWRLFNSDLISATLPTYSNMYASNDNPYIFTVLVTNENGCSTESDPFYVYVNDTILVEVTSTEDTICAGGEVTLTANLGNYNANNLIYRWYTTIGGMDDTEISGATQPTLVVNPSVTTNYSVRVIQTTSSCKAVGFDTVTVITAPDVTLSLTPADSICDGGQVTLTAAVVGEGSYAWYENGALISGATQNVYTVSPLTVDQDVTEYNYAVIFTPNIEGCVSAAVDTIVTVFANPSVQITGDPIVCGVTPGDNIHLTAQINNLIPNTTYKYQWMLNNVNIPGGDSQQLDQHQTYSDIPYIYTVRVMNLETGCITISEPFYVYVNDTADVFVTSTETAICENGEVTLTAHIGDYNMPNLTYQWYYVDGTTLNNVLIPGATESTYTTTVAASTTYNVVVTQTTSGCVGRGSVHVNAYERPTADLSIAGYTDTTICEGGEVTLTASASYNDAALTGTVTYAWYDNGALIEGVTGSTYTVSPTAQDHDTTVHHYQVIATVDASGCVSTISNQVDVNVITNPTVVISGDAIVCEHREIALTAGFTGSAPVEIRGYKNNMLDVVEWHYVPTPSRITYSNPSGENASDEPYMYSVEIVTGNGCVVRSEPYAVYVNATPVVTLSTNDATVCVGGEVTITANLQNQNTPDLTYAWNVGGIAVPEATSSTFTTTLNTDGINTIGLTLTQTTSQCVTTNTVNVNVYDIPTVSVALSEDNACSGYQITATATAAGGVANEAYTYTWYRNGELMEGVTAASFVDSPVAVDNDLTAYVYSAVATQSSSACSSLIAADTIYIYPNPSVVISGDPLICDGTTVELHANVNDYVINTDPLTYQWRLFNTDLVEASATTADLAVELSANTDPYIFTVEITNANGCRTISAPYNVYINDNIVVEVTATEDTICEGGEVTLTANIGDYNAPNLVYRWYTVDGGIETEILGATQATLTVHPVANTLYRVAIVQTTSLCSATGDKSISVIAAPDVTLNLNNAYICSGGEITLEAIGGNDEGIYTWYRNGQIVEGANMSTFTDSPMAIDNDSTAYTYGVVYTPAIEGCQSLLVDTVVYAYPNPTVVISGDPIICDGNNVILNANVVAADTILENLTYQWRLSNADITGATTDVLNQTYANSVDPYIFTVEVAFTNGCTSVSEPYNVYVNDSVRVAVTSNEDVICTNGEVTLTAHLVDNNSDHLTYQWYYITGANDTVAYVGATESTFTTSLAATTNFLVRIDQTTSSCVAYGSHEVTVVDVPTIQDITLNDYEVCEGYQISVTAAIDPAHAGVIGDEYIYTWYRNGIVIDGITGNTFTETPGTVDGESQVIIYSATVSQASSGCTSALVAASELTVNPNPTVEISGDQALCEGDMVTLYAHMNGTTLISPMDTEFTWFVNNDSTLMSGIITPPNTIYYTENLPRPAVDEPYYFTIQVNRGHGCTVESDPFAVYIYSAPVVNITASENVVCENGDVTLTAHLNDYNSDNIVYQWYENAVVPANIIEGATDRTYHIDSINMNSLYFVVATQTTSECADTNFILINVTEAPAITSIAIDENHICQGAQVTLTATAEGGVAGDAYNFTWYRNGQLLNGINDSTFVDLPTLADNNSNYFIYQAVVNQASAGCHSTMITSDTLFIIPNPTVEISGDPIICDGNIVDLTANVNDYDPATGALTYEWRLANAPIANGTTYSGVHATRDYPYIFTVAITNANGCVSVSNPYAVYVNDSIIVEVTHTADSICAGGEVTLTANLGDYNDNNLVYRWSTTTDTDTTEIWGATQRTLTVQPMATTHYLVRVLQSTSGCQAYGVDSLTVISAPVVNLFVSPNDTICDGGQVTLSATASGSGNFSWFDNGTLIEGANQNELTVSPRAIDGNVTTYNYAVIFTDNIEGCIPATADTTIYVYPNNTVEISGDPIVCHNSNIELQANINDSVDGATYSYQWMLSNADIAGATDATFTSATYAAQDYPYIFTVRTTNNLSGCTSVSDPFYVYVSDTALVVVSSSETNVCESAVVTLTANIGDYNMPNLTYQWFDGATPISGATQSTYTTAVPATTTYNVEVAQTTSGCVGRGSYTVNAFAVPTVSLAVGTAVDTNICEGGQITLTATPVADAALGNITYTWYHNGEVINDVTGATYTVSPTTVDNDATIHTYSVIATAEASACVSEMSNDVAVHVDANPVVVLSGDAVICENTPNSIFANITGTPNEPFYYTWYVNNEEVYGTTTELIPNRQYQYDETGFIASDEPRIYTMTLTMGNGCTVTSNPFALYVQAAPIVVLTASEDTICEGGEVTLTPHLNNQNIGDLTYIWKLNNTTINGATSSTYTTTLNNAGTQEFIVNIEQTTSACFATDTLNVEVMAVPTITNITLSQDSVCNGYQVTVAAQAQGGVDSDTYTYTWYRNGELMQGVTAASFVDSPVAVDDNITSYIYSAVVSQPSAGCVSAMNADTLVVYPNPSVVISGDPIICNGTTIILDANVNDYAIQGDALTYQWRLFNNNIATTQTLNIDTVASTDPYIFTVEVSNANGCSSLSEEYYVYVNENVQVEVTATEDTICAGGEVTFTANLGDYNSPNLIYRWYTVTATDTTEIWGATQPSLTVRPLQNAQYQVTILQTTSECLAIGFDSVQVIEAPIVTLDLSDNTICSGGQITLDATIYADGYYTWYKNGSIIPGANLATYTDSPVTIDNDSTSYTYGVVYTPLTEGCQSLLVDTVVYVFANPSVEISGDAIVCTSTPNNVTLTAYLADSTSASDGLTYQWRESNNIIAGETNATLIQTGSFRDNPYIYTAQISNTAGCVAMSDPYYVYVNDTILVEVTPSVDSICAGGEVTLTANIGDYNSPNLVYRWYTTEGAVETEIFGATSSQVVVNPINTTNYSVHVTQTTSQCNAVGHDTVEVVNAPIVLLAVSDDTICSGGQITLTATAAGDGVYTWYRNGVIVEGANMSTFTDSPMAMDDDSTSYTYGVIFTPDVEGCVSTLVDTMIYVYGNPTVVISGDPIICNTAANVELVANVNDNFEDLSIQWRLFNTDIADASAQTDTLRVHQTASVDPYIYTVVVSNEHGCTTMSEPYAVYVNDTADIQLVITADVDSVCRGGEVTMTAHLANYNSDNLTYQWYTIVGDDTLAIPGATSLYYHTTMEVTTNFMLEITQTTSGCVATGTKEIYVYPEIPFSISSIVALNTQNGTDIVCNGGEVEVSINLVDALGNRVDSTLYTYVWYRNGFEITDVHGPWFRESPLTVDDDTTHYLYSAVIVLDIPGCEFSNNAISNEVTVVRNPIVTISGNPYVCEYTPVALNAWVNGEIAPLTTTYNWYLDGEYRNTVNSYRFYYQEDMPVSAGYAYNYTVEAVDANGCSGVSPIFQVVVVSAPVAFVTATEDTVCTGGEVTFTANLQDYNIEHLVYQWYRNEHISSNMIEGATQSTYTTTLDATSTYIVEVYSTLVANDSLCTSVDGFQVVVVPDPVVDSVTITESTICEGGQVTVNAYVQGGVGSDAYNYTWYRNGDLMDGIHNASFIDNPMTVDGNITEYIYSAYVTQASAGCQSILVYSDTLTVHPNPTVVISGDPLICQDSTIHLTANVTGNYDDANLFYTWKLVNDTVGTGVDYDTVVAPRDYPYVYTVVVANNNGCLTESAPFYVYVNDSIIVEVTATETTICEGGQTTLTANLGDYNASDLQYRWFANTTNDADQIVGATEAQLTVEPTDTTTYFVRVYQDGSDCQSIGSYTINVNAIPVVDTVILTQYEICDGGQITITGQASGGVGTDYVYTWYRNGDLIEGVTASTFSESPMTEDGNITEYTYTAIVSQVASGCTSLPFTSDAIIVNPNPTVVISGDPQICEADRISLTANVTDNYPTAGLTYTWKLVNDTVGTGVAYDTLVPARDHAYTYTVVVANENGCVSESAPFSVTVNPRPVVEVTAYEETICEGGQTVLTANVDDNNLEDLMYRWFNTTMNDTIYGATQATLTVAPTATTQYFVQVYQVGSECVSTDSITINVNPIPVVDTVILTQYEICDGGQITITGQASGGVGTDYVYTWYRNGDLIEGVTASTFSESPMTEDGNITEYTYTAIVSQVASGCTSLPFTSDAIIVNPNPTVVISGDPQICEADRISLTANVTDNYPTAGLTYTWKLVNDTVGTGVAYDTLVPARDHAYTYTVVVANENGCVSESAPFSVTVNPRPVVEVTAYEETICEGGQTVLTANVDDNNLEDLMYRWFNTTMNDTIYGATQATLTVAPTATTEYFVQAYQIGSECISTDAITINVNPIPVVDSVILTEYQICEGGYVTVTAYATGGVGNDYTYTWYRNGDLIEGVTAATFTESPVTVDEDYTNYVYTAVASQIASGCTSLPVNSAVLNVYQNPVVEITGDPYICETDPIFVVANVDTSSIQVGGLHYQWFESGQLRDNLAYGYGDNRFFSEHFYARPNPYRITVEVTRGNGCRTLSEPFEVYVFERPIVTVTATETDICEGGNVTLTANLDDYNMDNLTYQWYTESVSGSNEIAGATEATYTANNIDTTTRYYVRVLHTLSECFDIDYVDVTVHTDPTVTLAISDGDTVICEGGQFELTASAVYDSILGLPTFTWYRNGSSINNSNDSVFIDSPVTVDGDSTGYTYGVLVTLSASGCQSTVSDTSTIHVTVLPNATIEIEGDPVVCGSGDGLDTLHLIANVNDTSALADGYTYEWRLFNRTITNDNDSVVYRADSNILDIVVVPSENPYIFTAIVHNENGCERVSEQFVVYVNDTTAVFVTASETEICEGGEVTLYANLGDYFVSNLAYQWYRDSVAIVGATGATYTTTLDTTTTFHVELTQTTSSCISYSAITINVHEDPTVTLAISDEDTVICEGGQFTLTATATHDSELGLPTYTWFRNGVEIENAYTNTLTESPVTVDGDVTNYTYSVLVTLTASGCQSVVTDSSTITVEVLPNATVEIEGDPIICGAGVGLDTLHLVANVNDTSALVDGYTYEWRLFNATIAETTNVLDTLLPVSDNPYIFTAIVHNENGCTYESAPFYVYVNDAAEVVVTSTENDICVGGEITVTANIGDYNMPNLTYQWFSVVGTDTTEIAGATQSTYTTILTTTTTFFVEIEQPTSSCLAYGNTTVNVHADPTVTLAISDEDTVICEGGEFTLTATATYDPELGLPTYTWFRNGVEIENAYTNTLTESPATVDGDVTNYTYSVLVTLTASGCQSVVTDSSTITVEVLPNATVEIEGDPIICGAGVGLDILHLVANVNDTSAMVDGYTYEWRLFNTTLAETTNVLDTLLSVSENPYIFTAIVHNENGCTSESAPFHVYVNDAAEVVVTSTENDICVGGEITVTANIGDYNMPNLTYQWFSVVGTDTTEIAGATQSTYTTILNTTTTFFVEIEQPTSSCLSYSNTTVNVHADPTVTLAISDEDTVVCEGGEFTLTATATYDPELGLPTYTWFRNGVVIENANTNTLTESPVTVDGDVTNYTYNVLVTLTASGCQSIVTDSSTITVEVLPNATVEIEGDPIICGAGVGLDILHLVANVNDTSAMVDGYTYEWRLFNTTLAETTNVLDTLLSVSENPYIFTAIVHNENGCTSESAPFYVYVNDAAEVVVTSTENDICVGGEITVTANIGDYNMPNLTYQWFSVVGTDTTEIAGATQSTYTTILNTTTTFFVEIEQPTSSCLSYSNTTVNVHADPTVTLAISDEDTVICEGGQFTLTATATYDPELGLPTYTWFRNGVVIENANTNTLTESPVTVD
ncbi:MAG: hypothetical protein M0P38_06275, partial [Bacteroidales bacterium]|nr:hypothetical protein [Bacteroidales bacterium]